MDDTIVAEIPKNQREVIRVTLGIYKDHQIANVRAWFRPNGGETLFPGKSGIAFRVELLPAVADALTEAVSVARESGLLR
jgi:hypothetical protein